MRRAAWLLLVVVFAACATAEAPPPDELADRSEQRCRGRCVQPPLTRDELPSVLIANQDRILAREDYKKRIPPKVSIVAHGPPPVGPLQGGEAPRDPTGAPYDGPLNWHLMAWEKVLTDEVSHRSFRRREVSGAHCFFAREPNYRTEIFALLAVHHPDRGDQLFFAGPAHSPKRADTVPLTDRTGQALRIDPDGILCAFRDDQNVVGALVVPFRLEGALPPDNGPRFAVFTVTTSNRRHYTGKTSTTLRAGGRGGIPEEKVVYEEEYLPPTVELAGDFDTLFEALLAAEESIPAGRFRLRPEFVYPRMPYLSYLGSAGEPQFCPLHTKCETPPPILDADVRPLYHLREELKEDLRSP